MRGRKPKVPGFTQEELDDMVDRHTLQEQIGKSINTRADLFTQKLNKVVTPKFLRQIYKGRGVSRQMIVTRLGKKKLQPVDEQAAHIRKIQGELQGYHDSGLEIVQVDECIFTANRVNDKVWAPTGKPWVKNTKWAGVP